MAKSCPDDQILNPKSNRCVKKNGKIGKELLKTSTKKHTKNP